MQGSYAALRSSDSLFDSCDPMELQQEDSYFKQPLLVGERLNYVEPQPQYYDTVHGLVDQNSVANSAGTHNGTYRNAAPLLGLGLPTSLFQSNCFRDRWRYHETLEGQGQSYVPDFQPSPAQYLNQGFVYPSQPAFDEPCNNGGTSDVEVWNEDMTSSSTSPKIDSSPSVEIWPLESEESISAFCSEPGMLTKDSQDDEEDSGDKPYARLIHEALMQAPGHRMMLREIYDWFVQNTTKPSESGTNGWQNSIRHNLSMNQAFENDRTDPENPGHQARKANSVWILTEDAIRHGVQSTTRYRKHGSNKKTNRARIPAPLRQRSGAKGGRAARRAAKLRREEQMNRRSSNPNFHSSRFQKIYGLQDTDGTSQEADQFSIASPLTPQSEQVIPFPQSSDSSSYYYHLPEFYDLNSEPLPGQIEPAYEGELQSKAETCMKETLHYPYGSPTEHVAR